MDNRKVLKGRVWKFGDNIDTDVITPADTTSFGLGDEGQKRLVIENAFRAIRRDFYKLIRKGDILVAGRNFGYGSHREQANTVLPSLGFSAVVAESIARLYYRNSIAIGFPAFQVPGITEMVAEGDELQIDMRVWKMKNLSRGTEIDIEPFVELIQKILTAGGILEVLGEHISR